MTLLDFSSTHLEIGIREEKDRTFWKVQPPPKRKEVEKTAGEVTTLEKMQH
jgi:hypothetical protein